MCSHQKRTTVEQQRYRLPETVVPSFYDLRIEPDLKHFTFAGEEKIAVQIHEPVKQIVLNAADMKIHEALLTDDAGTQLIGTISHDEQDERATITFDATAGSGHWELDLKFSGVINDKLKGFYRSFYKNAAGEQEVLVTTKFEPCDARRAFPCFDEPAFKARFKVSLVIDEEFTGISNTRLMKTTPLGNGKKMLEFAPSIVMSTYLVSFRVGKFVATEAVKVRGKELRVMCVPGKEHLTGFALEIGKFALEYFADYFEQPYPGDKMDLVAIPDFASGAMEEFGNPAFRETALLVDLKTASHAELLRVAEVVAHELAHMWFGDFVTMDWWNGLWLNEAFATFMAAKCMHAFKPEWKFWEGFNVDRAAAMKTDGLKETRSIEFPVNKPEEARGMFDILTYEKGCAILRMLELFLGEEQFRKGIVNYLAKHAFANADTPDLWAALEERTERFSANVTVTDLMNTWVFQAGHPVVAVSESPITGSVVLSQQVFRYLQAGETPGMVWQVPVHIRATVRGIDGPTVVDKVVLLSNKQETVYIGEDLGYLVVNAGGDGFFRVRYSDSLRQKLLDNVTELNTSERFNFVNDMWASVQSGQVSVKDYVATVQALTAGGGRFSETDVNVFTIILGSLSTIRTIVPATDEKTKQALLEMARAILQPVQSKLGFAPIAGEPPQEAQLRGQVMSTLGQFGDPDTVERARQLFAQWKKDRTSVDSNLMGAVVSTLAANGDAALYDEFVALKNAAATPQEEQRFLMALAGFRDAALAERTRKACVDGTIRLQDAPLLLQMVLMNTAVVGQNADGTPVTIAAQTWEFIKSHWNEISEKYPMQHMNRLCSGVTALISPALEADVRRWFADHEVKSAAKAVKQYQEQLSINVRLAEQGGREAHKMLLAGSQQAM